MGRVLDGIRLSGMLRLFVSTHRVGGLPVFLCTAAFCPHQRYFWMVGTRTFLLIGFALHLHGDARTSSCISSRALR